MKKRQEHLYDAPIDQVWAMYRDPASHVAKFESMGHRNLELLEEDVSDDAVRVVIARDVTVDLPGFAKKVLKPTNRVTSIDEWSANGDGTYGGTFTTETKGAPVHIAGTTHLEAEGEDRTRFTVEVEVRIDVPLIGGKLSRWAEGDVEETFRQEFAAGDRWLAEHA
ncbi:DUF2505 domain-containing protein [Nitriliruptoraceae bacterium ZYF776]|nr:DUF2505 domain-containing protein [Profundirhabdus halotolerans]